MQTALALPASAQTGTSPNASRFPKILPRCLVLSGGGALGAYEAGVVAALVSSQRISEGQPLPQYGAITGASIGALNGYLAATGQWSKLTSLWSRVAYENAVRLKPEYAKITNTSSGVGNRLAQLFALGLGANKDVQGVYDGAYLQTWINSYFDFSKPILTPFIWSVTNLTRQTAEYFYALPKDFDRAKLEFGLTSIKLSVGDIVPVREADPQLLPQQLLASAMVPVAFDPVNLPGPTPGHIDQYCDGGVTANTPIAVARALSNDVDAVLLSPPLQRETYDNIVDVTSGSFGTMQRRMMYDAIRTAELESLLYQTAKYIPDPEFARMTAERGLDPSMIRAFSDLLYNTSYYILRPEKPLPATLLGFDDAKAISSTYELGVQAGLSGFKAFDLRTMSD